MNKVAHNFEDEANLRRLREILLQKDRAELDALRNSIHNPDLLAEKVNPIIQEELAFFKSEFPKEFKKVIEKMIDKRIEASQAHLMNVMYPILGKMIRRYITLQFQIFQERLETQLQKGFIGRIRATFFGVKQSEYILSGLNDAVIEEIYVIERYSGLLIGSASIQEVVDKDMVAGMLTAIKSFVEDAFQQKQQNLEMVQYENYEIFIQNYHTYYIAVALNGGLTASQQEALAKNLSTFAEKHINPLLKAENPDINFHIREQLNKHFINPQKKAKLLQSLNV